MAWLGLASRQGITWHVNSGLHIGLVCLLAKQNNTATGSIWNIVGHPILLTATHCMALFLRERRLILTKMGHVFDSGGKKALGAGGRWGTRACNMHTST